MYESGNTTVMVEAVKFTETIIPLVCSSPWVRAYVAKPEIYSSVCQGSVKLAFGPGPRNLEPEELPSEINMLII